MKYFLLGAFASGFFLYGIALIYGATRSTNLDKIGAAVKAGAGRDPLLLIGFALLLVGFGFKISAVPFHMWTADVYEGAPTSVTAFIASGSKAAAFAALLRLLLESLRPLQGEWTWLFWVLAALSMTLGNVVAIAQQNLKRMLAYSSIAHVGYMLVGIVAGGGLGGGSVLFYLLVYTFTIAGAFGSSSSSSGAAKRRWESATPRAWPPATHSPPSPSPSFSFPLWASRPPRASWESSTSSALPCAPATCGWPSSAC
jgi:NADH-quinone oxidoreductase subunit N